MNHILFVNGKRIAVGTQDAMYAAAAAVVNFAHVEGLENYPMTAVERELAPCCGLDVPRYIAGAIEVLMCARHTVPAIKLLRSWGQVERKTTIGLKEAKDWCCQFKPAD
jgi:hypothetical protein